jgi:hypothetical protein
MVAHSQEGKVPPPPQKKHKTSSAHDLNQKLDTLTNVVTQLAVRQAAASSSERAVGASRSTRAIGDAPQPKACVQLSLTNPSEKGGVDMLDAFSAVQNAQNAIGNAAQTMINAVRQVQTEMNKLSAIQADLEMKMRT